MCGVGVCVVECGNCGLRCVNEGRRRSYRGVVRIVVFDGKEGVEGCVVG